MLFTIAFTYAIALAATAVPMVAAEYQWNPKLQIHTLGDIPAAGAKTPARATQWMGRCNGGDINVGGYGCGNFGSIGTVIYECVKYKKDGYWLRRKETCYWANAVGGQCVKNSLKNGAKFYPLVDSDKVVCVQPTDI
jgi:hypothetical protein